MSEIQAAGSAGPRRRWILWIAGAVIIGLIVMVAVASYGDYTHRAQNSEAIYLMGSARTPLAEYFAEHKKWPDNLDKVIEPASGKYAESVRITTGAGGAGEIELTATMRTEGVDRRVAGMTVLMGSADGGKTWTCRAGTMPEKYLPGACRKS
jgi:type IV pilus assembly protein PilA